MTDETPAQEPAQESAATTWTSSIIDPTGTDYSVASTATEPAVQTPALLGVVAPPAADVGTTADVGITADSPRSDILRDAHAAVCNDRNASYGEPRDNFSAIAQMWTIYLQNKLAHLENLSAKDVGDLFILAKMGRNIHGNTTRDTYVDIAGYAACAWECDVSCPR